MGLLPLEPTLWLRYAVPYGMSTEPTRILRAILLGLSPWLVKEIESLGYAVENKDHTGVEIKGRMADARNSFFISEPLMSFRDSPISIRRC